MMAERSDLRGLNHARIRDFTYYIMQNQWENFEQKTATTWHVLKYLSAAVQRVCINDKHGNGEPRGFSILQ